MGLFDKLADEEEAEAKESASKKKKVSKKVEVEEHEPARPAKKDPELQEETDWLHAQGELAVDVYEEDKNIVVQAAIAGVDADDLDVTIESDVVVIRGERHETKEKEERNYYYQECFWGAFSREVLLPEEVDVKGAKATFEQGVLKLTMPKLQREKVKKVKITAE